MEKDETLALPVVWIIGFIYSDKRVGGEYVWKYTSGLMVRKGLPFMGKDDILKMLHSRYTVSKVQT